MDLFHAVNYYRLPKFLSEKYYYNGENYICYIDQDGMDVEFSPSIDNYFTHTEETEEYVFIVESPLNYATYQEDDVLIVKEREDGELIFWDGKYIEKKAAITFYDKKEKILFEYNMKTRELNKRRCD